MFPLLHLISVSHFAAKACTVDVRPVNMCLFCLSTGSGFTQVLIQAGGADHLLCTLMSGVIFQQYMNIKLSEGEKVTLSVEGTGTALSSTDFQRQFLFHWTCTGIISLEQLLLLQYKSEWLHDRQLPLDNFHWTISTCSKPFRNLV